MPNNLIKLGFDNFLENFQNYAKENPDFTKELELLKTNLDEPSIKNLNRFLDKVLRIAKLPTRENPMGLEEIFSQEDLEVIEKETLGEQQKRAIYEKYQIPKDFLLEIPVFYYHCGLKFLPKSLIEKIKGKTLIDGGSYFGDSALIFNEYNPQKIYAFEPSSVNYQFLLKTIKSNQLNDKIIPINLALAAKKEASKLFFNSLLRPNLGASLTSALKKKFEEVKTTTIDEFILENKIDDLALIKLDIEGFELEAILGAKSSILKFKPVLLIAVYHNMEELLKIKPFLEGLNPAYKFSLVPLHRQTILQEFYLIAY